MKRAVSFLLALSAPLLAGAAGAEAVGGPLSGGPLLSGPLLSGTVEGNVAPGSRLGAWAVSPFGQPLQPLADVPVQGGKFTLTLPGAAPAERLRFAVGERTSWPGLVDFAGTSVPLTATELKFFLYRDANGNGQRDEGEALREVRPSVGKGELFVVWAAGPGTVTGAGGYEAELQAGWNTLVVEVRRPVRVQPYGGAPVQINLGR